ncbi:MAG: response regulator [Gammaproteobacteria bacterium]|nr:response regulator [Gammaproteobacteria bacterium]
MRVLLVEDDEMLGGGLQSGLTQDGYAVDWVKDGDAAELFLRTEEYEIVILDLGLPKKSGLEVLKHLRSEGSDIPVLILTARDSVDDRVKGLDCGADDYMIKPFDLDELNARIRALMRRRSGRAETVITHGELIIDPASHTVQLRGEPVDLSPREFTLLEKLLESRGRVLSRSQLEQSIYSWKDEVDSNAVEVHIHHLRKKIGSEMIRTVRGVGYIIDKAPKE